MIRITIFLLVAVLMAGLALTGVLWRRAEMARKSVLPGGTMVELLGVAFGNEPFTTEKKWHKTARRFLPSLLQKWIPSAVSGTCSSSTNGITIYVRCSPGTSPPWQNYATEDEVGFRYPADGGSCSFSDSKGNMIHGLILRSFPRRQKEFLFRLLDREGQVLGTFTVQNPMTGLFPEWQSLPLPQTQTYGPVSLTLKGFEERVNGRWTNVIAQWGLQASDPAWTGAKARSQTFLDPTGNEGWHLSPREPVWKVRTLLYRDYSDRFSPSEQLIVTNILLPAPGSFTAIDQGATCAGVGLKVLVLASAGSFGLSNGVTRFMLPASQGISGHSISSGSGGTIETWGSATPFLMLEARNVQSDDELRVIVHDQNGEVLKVVMNGYESSSGQVRIYKPSFTAGPETKSVSIRILANRPLPFEFPVNSADVLRKN
ncbi:MAG TPA: hypothetical protein VMZ27_06580 [Candidatus Saccharimonadales bacterium]|nr:hypothetical protein [Candidatus Saccharimonadales bacterium]